MPLFILWYIVIVSVKEQVVMPATGIWTLCPRAAIADDSTPRCVHRDLVGARERSQAD